MIYRSPSESALGRVHGYREMAQHARDMAATAELPQVRDAYMRSAERWTTLADLVEMGDALPPSAMRPTGWRTTRV